MRRERLPRRPYRLHRLIFDAPADRRFESHISQYHLELCDLRLGVLIRSLRIAHRSLCREEVRLRDLMLGRSALKVSGGADLFLLEFHDTCEFKLGQLVLRHPQRHFGFRLRNALDRPPVASHRPSAPAGGAPLRGRGGQ